MTAKKQSQKQQEPEPEPQAEEVYRPMGVQDPTPLERLEALTIRVTVLEEQYRVLEGRVSQHNRYHFGKST